MKKGLTTKISGDNIQLRCETSQQITQVGGERMKKIKSHKRKNLIVISVTTGEKDLAEKEIKKTIRKWNRLFGKFEYEIVIN